MIKKILVFGASITSSPWWTWKDFLEMESGISVIDLSRRGAGNEYMTHSLMDVGMDENTLVVGMLTNVDKFDWYVEGNQYHDLCKEKHPPIPVGDSSGFWCTGSWFPENKEIYRKYFFNLDYFCTKTIHQISLIKNICKKHNSKVEIFFDSPIWDYTEQQLNQFVIEKIPLASKNLLDLPLSSRWKNLLDDQDLFLKKSSLIGYCIDQQLPWHNRYYKGHPPSSSHWKYFQDMMKPRISQHLDLCSIDIESMITKMDAVWNDHS